MSEPVSIADRRRAAIQHQREAAKDLIYPLGETIGALSKLMQSETEFIRKGDLKSAAALIEEKARLAGDYQRQLSAVRDEAHWIGRVVPEHCRMLREALAEFQNVLSVNLAVVGTARAVHADLLVLALRAKT
ncbi:hypothetical protein IZ6_07610 [Terrihabitans soli]|uniref:Flagellar protein FlgN n=1 Tax=Terrihabitans soli TaxID=708113 RepID=A0A6S6QL55_9HYPH|nr:hypothetical protein [Terrihabitans soli]BCJ90026.1 hypothetical protein IZ6_07610 [Terrihabitans soli]